MTALLSVVAFSLLAASSDPACDVPRPRDVAPLLAAIADDDAMAGVFDATAAACTGESLKCDEQRLKCGERLATTLQKQVNVDDGTWLRDMLLPVMGQQYMMTIPVPRTDIAQDVSCNVDAPTLKGAAQRRRQLAARRRDLVNEYPKWASWSGGLGQKCRSDKEAALKAQADAIAATAKAQAEAAAAAKRAEEQRQEAQRKAEQEKKQQLERQAESQRESEAARKKNAEKFEVARKEEEAKKARVAQEQADARAVASREAQKEAAEKKLEAMEDQEKQRQKELDKQRDELEKAQRGDGRLKGSLGAQLHGGYASLGNVSGFIGGVLINFRYGLWLTAPVRGISSGLELKINGAFWGLIAGSGTYQSFTATPEVRWFIGRFGVGAAFEWRHLTTSVPTTTDPFSSYALGATVAFAMIDTHDSRAVATLRWMPLLNAGTAFAPERLSLELEFGYKVFIATIHAGTVTVRNGNSTQIGGLAGLGLGARFRF